MSTNGLHLLDFKELSKNSPTESFPYPDKVVIPLSQHAGIPAMPVVTKGQNVEEGQVIAEANGFISSFIHSSISGVVTDIKNGPLPTGKNVTCVFIENNGEMNIAGRQTNRWENLRPDEITAIIKSSGIVGLGGAAFPTHVKLTPPKGKRAEYVILNGCECEPFLTSDYRVMKERPVDIIEGLAIICRAAGVKKAFIGIESNKKDLLPAIKAEADKYKAGLFIKLITLPERYPQGSEKHLIYSVTKKQVPSGGLPIDVACVVFNVQTAVAVKEAVKEGIPLTERVLTVSGLVDKPKNLKVRIGTNVSEILEYTGAKLTEGSRLVIGGPMMGLNPHTTDIPVIKSTSGILILPHPQIPDEIMGCIRCGKCIEVCPMNLAPAHLSRYAEARKWEACGILNVSDCIECGCCSYTCPAKRPLTELFKWAKAEIKKNPS